MTIHLPVWLIWCVPPAVLVASIAVGVIWDAHTPSSGGFFPHVPLMGCLMGVAGLVAALLAVIVILLVR